MSKTGAGFFEPVFTGLVLALARLVAGGGRRTREGALPPPLWAMIAVVAPASQRGSRVPGRIGRGLFMTPTLGQASTSRARGHPSSL